ELGRLLVDEAVAGVRLREEPEPRGADALEVLDRDQRGVARAAPTLDVAAHRRLARLGDAVDAPVVGVPQHVAQKGHVLRAGGPDHERSSVSWIRLPSGSMTSTTRIAPCSSSTVPTSTPASASRSRSAFRSATSIVATASSSVGGSALSPSAIS